METKAALVVALPSKVVVDAGRSARSLRLASLLRAGCWGHRHAPEENLREDARPEAAQAADAQLQQQLRLGHHGGQVHLRGW